jgi:hypothetical protein
MKWVMVLGPSMTLALAGVEMLEIITRTMKNRAKKAAAERMATKEKIQELEGTIQRAAALKRLNQLLVLFEAEKSPSEKEVLKAEIERMIR